MIYPDKFPDLGISIFPVMSALSQKHNAINLAQGFPGFPMDPALIDLVHKYMHRGLNQYSPMPGVPVLRETLSEKQHFLYNTYYNPDTEITVFGGATESIFCAISALVEENDEIIYFEPVFDIYPPAISLNKGIGIPISLKLPDFDYDWDEVKSKVTSKTKLIILNSPHNPTGKVLNYNNLQSLKSIVENTSILILSDEVYEHMVFDNQQHLSLSADPALKERSVIVASLGKVLHCTGWRIGYILAPATLTSAIRKVHQFVTFSANTPVQYAMAEYLMNRDSYLNLAVFFQNKRDLFASQLKSAGFIFKLTEGSYFQIASYSGLTDLPDLEFARELTINYGVATIPVSPFYKQKTDNQLIRFCFAKTNEELVNAGEKLKSLTA